MKSLGWGRLGKEPTESYECHNLPVPFTCRVQLRSCIFHFGGFFPLGKHVMSAFSSKACPVPGNLTHPDKNPELINLEGFAFLIKNYDPSLVLLRPISSNLEASQKESFAPEAQYIRGLHQ